MKFTDLKDIDFSEIDTVRGNTGFTSLYMKNGNVIYVKETFKEVVCLWDLFKKTPL